MEEPEKIKSAEHLKKGDRVYVWFPDKGRNFAMKVVKITKRTITLESGNVVLKFDKWGRSNTNYSFQFGYGAYIIEITT